MSPITFKTEEWEAVHGPRPKQQPLWPKSGVVLGLRLPTGSKVGSRPLYDGAVRDWGHEFVIALPDMWSATGQAKSMRGARRIAVEKVKAELARRDAERG